MTRRRYLSTWLQRRVAGEGPLSAVWSPIASNDDYLLSAINLSEPQYALRNAAYQP